MYIKGHIYCSYIGRCNHLAALIFMYFYMYIPGVLLSHYIVLYTVYLVLSTVRAFARGISRHLNTVQMCTLYHTQYVYKYILIIRMCVHTLYAYILYVRKYFYSLNSVFTRAQDIWCHWTVCESEQKGTLCS